MLKACLLALLSIALFLYGFNLDSGPLKQFVEIVAAGAAVFCFMLVTKETQSKK